MKHLYGDKPKAWHDGWFCGMFEYHAYKDKNMYRRILRRFKKYCKIRDRNTVQEKTIGLQFMEGMRQGEIDRNYLWQVLKKTKSK